MPRFPHATTSTRHLPAPARHTMRDSLAAWLLAGAALWLAAPSAHARPAPTVVEAVQLPAWVERHGQRRPAQAGASLRVGDKAITSSQARMLLRLPDRSEVKLGESTELVIDQMDVTRQGAAQPKQTSAALRLVTGVFRYATHIGSKLAGDTRRLNLKLTTATVGIRGTDFWSMTDASHDAVCVFEGQVAVQTEAKEEIQLARPGAFWVTLTGQPPRPAGQASPEQLLKFIGQAELTPGSGVVVQGGRWRAVLGLLPTATSAATLRERLAAAGYPAEVLAKDGQYEVRVNQFATEQDARAVVERLSTQSDLKLQGARVALAAN